MLLMFAVHFLRIGIERLWSHRIKAAFSDKSRGSTLIAKGLGLGFIMQGATVVTLMVAGFAGSGLLRVGTAALIALGADLGSAIVVAFLSLPVFAIGPILTTIGAVVYLRNTAPRKRNLGRITLGLGLVFLSISIIRGAAEPLGSGVLLASVIKYLESDWVTAGLVGMALTLLMHSSVAAILSVIAFAAASTISAGAGLALMLGCNVGSALLALWLLRGQGNVERAVAKTVATLRVSCAVIVLGGLALYMPNFATDTGTAKAIVFGHVIFNGIVALTFPLVAWLAPKFAEGRPDRQRNDAQPRLPFDPDDPELGLVAMRQHVSHMLDHLSELLLIASQDAVPDERIADLNRKSARELDDTRELYVSFSDLPKSFARQMMQIVEFAIRVKRSCDIAAGTLFEIGRTERQGLFRFSTQGRDEIEELRLELSKSLLLARQAVWTNDAKAARHLLERKARVTKLERESKAAHLERIRLGNRESLASSDRHLEAIASLKEINSKLATIGYAIADNAGGLRKSRMRNSFAEQG